MTRLVSAMGALMCASFLPGVPITGLFNTGVDSAGLQLAGGNGVNELHWLQNGLTAVTFNSGPPYVTETGPAPGSTASRWISSAANGSVGTGAPFTLTFDLTGYDPATASITGRWAVDNCGSASLNGNTAFSVIGDCEASSSFSQWTNFSISSGFLPGLNTLRFDLVNTPLFNFIPTEGAIRVEFLSSDVQRGVPEPGTTALATTGMAGLYWLRRRRR